jgi:hypothetical protein
LHSQGAVGIAVIAAHAVNTGKDSQANAKTTPLSSEGDSIITATKGTVAVTFTAPQMQASKTFETSPEVAPSPSSGVDIMSAEISTLEPDPLVSPIEESDMQKRGETNARAAAEVHTATAQRVAPGSIPAPHPYIFPTIHF